jgi:signal transduction histidine kinase
MFPWQTEVLRFLPSVQLPQSSQQHWWLWCMQILVVGSAHYCDYLLVTRVGTAPLALATVVLFPLLVFYHAKDWLLIAWPAILLSAILTLIFPLERPLLTASQLTTDSAATTDVALWRYAYTILAVWVTQSSLQFRHIFRLKFVHVLIVAATCYALSFHLLFTFITVDDFWGSTQWRTLSRESVGIVGSVLFHLQLCLMLQMVRVKRYQMSIVWPLKLVLALVCFAVGLWGVMQFDQALNRYLILFLLLPGLWFSHRMRWWGLMSFALLINVLTVFYIALFTAAYDASAELPNITRMLSHTLDYQLNFNQYLFNEVGFTLFEMSWFLLAFNLVCLYLNAMIFELDTAQHQTQLGQVQLEHKNASLRQLNHNVDAVNRHLVQAQEKQRQLLARELDTYLHEHLSHFSAKITAFEQQITPEMRGATDEATAVPLQQLKDYTANIHQSIFEIVNKIKPQPLISNGLFKLLQSEHFASKLALAKISYQFTSSAGQIDLAEPLSLALYRIVQETVNNTIKYSQATTYHIDMQVQSEQLLCIIEDNGVGFDFDDTQMG